MTIKAMHLVPAHAIHPGETLKDELQSRKISQTDFANDTGISLQQLNEIIKGKRNVSADTALLLEKGLGIEAYIWMNLQTAYELDVSRLKDTMREKLALMERWNIIKGVVPVKYFKKQNELNDSLEENERKIKEIYDVQSIDEIVNVTSKASYAHFKKSAAFSENTINVAGWVKYVEYQSKKKSVGHFSTKSQNELIGELKKISTQSDLVLKTEKLLNKFGIKFINQPKPDKAPIDGVSLWLDKNPTIGVTLRYHRIDNFIFTVMHELAHVYLHLSVTKKGEFVDDLENHQYMNNNNLEKEANKFASDNLISSEQWESFMTQHFSIDEEAIIEFAKELKIHPAIVKGRLCFEYPTYYRKRFSIPNEIN